VTSLATVTSRREARAVAEAIGHSRDHDLEPLVPDITSESELLTRLGDLESELVRVHATLASEWWPSGPVLLARIGTAAIAGDERLVMRLPADLVDALDLAKGCTVTLTGPLGRAGLTAQPSAFGADALEVESCPAPRLLSAVATATTAVTLRFDRQLAPLPSPHSSPSDLALITSPQGSVSFASAAVSGRELHLETAPQSPVTCTVIVVEDTLLPIGAHRRDWTQTLVSDGHILLRHPDWDSAYELAFKAASDIKLFAQ
jgi:hypothetical protein